MSKVHVKTNDQVVVISGPKTGDKAIQGKQGKILSVDTKNNRVVVEGVAFVTKHLKPRRQGQQGGIIQKERSIDASNVMLVCPKCKKATRVGHSFNQAEGGKARKVRVCKKCGAAFDN